MFIFYRDHSSNKTTRWKSVQPGIYLDNKWMQAPLYDFKKAFLKIILIDSFIHPSKSFGSVRFLKYF